jgi:hypothetical protein
LTDGSVFCTSCGTSDCAPTPSCGSDPSPSVSDHARPVLSREERERANVEFEAEFGADVSMVDESSICTSCGTSDCAPTPSCGSDPSPSVNDQIRPVLTRVAPVCGSSNPPPCDSVPLMANESSICTSCGTSDCAPTPSCGSDPSPSIDQHVRPVLARV